MKQPRWVTEVEEALADMRGLNDGEYRFIRGQQGELRSVGPLYDLAWYETELGTVIVEGGYVVDWK
jgi:hypothetical protein